MSDEESQGSGKKRVRRKPVDEAPPPLAAEVVDDETEDADAPPEAGDEDPVSEGPLAEAGSFRAWLGGARIPREMSLLFGLILPVMLLLVNMWTVRSFTVDDSYISFRYARNFARGLGLVYNPGERIEGYTNFLWTVMLGIGFKLGVEPDVLAKVLGGAAAVGSMALTYTIAARLRPYRTAPCVATWLLASTIVFSGYAVFGLETAFFVCLILAGTLLFLRENEGLFGPGGSPNATQAAPGTPGSADRQGDPGVGGAPVAPDAAAFPWSGLVFGLAGLTRPEAPMYIGILMLFLGRRFFARQNLLRGALFVVPVAAHLLFRHSYYGTWVPNTLSAKTGNLDGQLSAGLGYVQSYLGHAGPVIWLGLLGLAMGIVRVRRDLLALSAIALAVLGYVILVGGDWMPFFRFLAPFEPFCFLIVDVGVRSTVDRRRPAPNLALALFGVAMVAHRGGMLREAQSQFLTKEKHFWDMAAGGTARWLKDNTTPGEVAIGDIGYVGYVTDYPILDLLGLVDPVISKLPGGYTQKLGPGFNERFFERMPKYMLLISSSIDCMHPSVPGSQVIYRDRRFLPNYQVAGKVPLDGGFAWCIYSKR